MTTLPISSCKGAFLCAALVALLASRVSAATLILDTNSFSDSYGGGEFTAISATLNQASYSPLTIVSSLHGTGFETFCMEYGEHFTPGGTYDYTIGNAAIGGDLPAGFDTVSKGTAWLYAQFASGSLAGYNYGGTAAQRKLSALQLQLAFWYLEDETTLSSFVSAHGVFAPASNAFIGAAITNFGGLDGPSGAHGDNAAGGYGVYILNLTSNGGRTLHQSQINYSVPDNGITLALVGTSFLGLVALRRKLQKNA